MRRGGSRGGAAGRIAERQPAGASADGVWLRQAKRPDATPRCPRRRDDRNRRSVDAEAGEGVAQPSVGRFFVPFAGLAALGGLLARRLGQGRVAVALHHLLEEELRVLTVALRLERHADLQERVGHLLRVLVLLEHLLELDDGVVPLLLTVVRLPPPFLPVGRPLLLP